MNDSLDHLRSRISAARRVGQVLIGRAARDDASLIEAADAAVTAAGAVPIGAAWQLIDAVRAHSLLGRLLAKDQAYESRCMSDSQATSFADEILSLIEDPTEFLTNVDQETWLAVRDGQGLRAVSSTPVTSATFSAAVVFVGRSEAAAFVVSDED